MKHIKVGKHTNIGVLFVALFAVAGVLALVVSHAATPYVSLEAESGTVANGASVVSNLAGASGSSAVKFGVPAVTGSLIPDSDIPLYTSDSTLPLLDASGEGNFRLVCSDFHLNYDDPIVFPGQKGAAHLHMFFGNDTADYTTNAASLLRNGSSTCNGGPLNRSSYWAPAMFDTNGKVRMPKYVTVYYKSGGHDPTKVNAFPDGLRMIAGNSTAAAASDNRTGTINFGCDSTAVWSNNPPVIPSCATGVGLIGKVVFPSCWDGVNIDSANHKTHVVYPILNSPSASGPNSVTCPADHATIIPEVTYQVFYENPDMGTAGWHISSDHLHNANGTTTDVAGGTTWHADWFGAWQPTILSTWIANCTHAKRNCEGGQLGTNKHLNSYLPFIYPGPYIINAP